MLGSRDAICGAAPSMTESPIAVTRALETGCSDGMVATRAVLVAVTVSTRMQLTRDDDMRRIEVIRQVRLRRRCHQDREAGYQHTGAKAARCHGSTTPRTSAAERTQPLGEVGAAQRLLDEVIRQGGDDDGR